MPILAPEADIYPANLLAEFLAQDTERVWWAAHTKPRQEKSLARQLLAQDVPFYLPLVKRRAMINGRRRESQVPLFPSYVFVCADAHERIKTLETKRVVQLLPSRDGIKIWRDLRNVQALVASGAPLTVEAQLEPGDRVRVKSGSLMGLEGVIVSRRGESRLLVAVEFLQQGVSILVEDFQVEPV